MTVFKWSQTAASDATADPSINWAEGQAPSTVNDSARAMMAAIAKFRDDLSGNSAGAGTVNVTGGTSTAYTLTSNQGFTTLAAMSGMTITFQVHATNGANATLNVDGLGAKNLLTSNGVNLPDGSLTATSIYSATYFNGAPGWYVHGGWSAVLAAPSGTAMLFQQTTAPIGWTKSTTHNDKALRVVSGTPGSGGSVAFSTLFGRTGTDAVTLASANIPNFSCAVTDPNHLHSVPYTLTGIPQGTGGLVNCVTVIGSGASSGNTGSSSTGVTVSTGTAGSSFTPTIDCRVLYVDVMIATKD